MIKQILTVLLVVIVLGALLPILLPMFFDTTADIAATNTTAAEMDVLESLWPIALMIIVIGIAAGIIFYALRKFEVIS